MKRNSTISRLPFVHRAPSRRLLAVGAVVAGLAVTAACSLNDVAARDDAAVQSNAASRHHASLGVPAAAPDAALADAGVIVACPAGTQAFVTPAIANGRAVSQVTCVTDGPTAAALEPVPAAVPVAYGRLPAGYAVMPAAAPAVIRPMGPVSERVVYTQPRRAARASRSARHPARTWKKSAVIIGSSAGVGAGLGAVFGGKKGALLGAVIGGGGAAVWDQTTRRH